MSAPRPRTAAIPEADTTIEITRFPSLKDPRGEEDSYADWAEFTACFATNADVIASKDEGEGWSPATFTNNHRAKKNVERVSCLVLDYDAGTTPIQAAFMFWSLDAFATFNEETMRTTACLLHTSFSHTAEHPKFRVVMPFSRSVDPSEFAAIWSYVADVAVKAGHTLDLACKDPSRLWFCPAAKVGEPAPMFRFHDDGAEPLDVERVLKECGYKSRINATAKTAKVATLSLAPRTFDRGVEEVRRASSGTRNATLNRVAYTAGMAIGGGILDEARARDELRTAGLACGLDEAEVDKTLDRAIERGRENPTTSHGDRPVVKLDTELHQQVQDSMRALSTHPDLFEKDAFLVSINARSSEVVSLDEYRVQEMMSECAEWLEYSAKDEGYKKKAVPPKRLAESIARRRQWDHIRSLRAVTAFPVLDEKGNLHISPGYSEATRTYYAGSLPIQVPDVPTRDDAKAAIEVLLDIVGDFPFVNDAHKSAWLAALLSPLSRFMHDGNIPLILIQANDRRVGKSLLAAIISMIVNGRAPATMTHVANGDEERKRVGAILLAGHPVVLIDNVESQFGGQNMNALITSRVFEDRILGRTALLRAENNAVWIVNGKNMTLAPDMAQRSLHIRLQCNDEKPELREGFKYADLEATVLERRADLLGAALTILRAYVVAGMPPQKLPAWGSFEPWSRLIRGALVWAGMPDPALTREELEEEADTELSFEVGMIEGWQEAEIALNKFTGLTASEVLKHLEHNSTDVCPILREALVRITPMKCALPGPNKLGVTLGAIKRKIRGGKMIEKAGSGKESLRWAVVTLPVT